MVFAVLKSSGLSDCQLPIPSRYILSARVVCRLRSFAQAFSHGQRRVHFYSDFVSMKFNMKINDKLLSCVIEGDREQLKLDFRMPHYLRITDPSPTINASKGQSEASVGMSCSIGRTCSFRASPTKHEYCQT